MSYIIFPEFLLNFMEFHDFLDFPGVLSDRVVTLANNKALHMALSWSHNPD